MSQSYMAGKTLAEKQMYYYNGHKCPYCDGFTELVDSIEVYRESYGLVYLCRKCSAHVGVHRGSDQALGCLAKKSLRDLRHEAHKWFDPLCEARMQKGISKKKAKAKGYKWLSGLLKIDPIESHIGYFNEEQCKVVIEECKKFYPSDEEIRVRNERRKLNIDAVRFNSGYLGLELKEFNLNGSYQMELRSASGRVFKYDPYKDIGKWDDDKAFYPVEDIDKFIETNFKNKNICQNKSA